jgi:leucyl aminopeptidase
VPPGGGREGILGATMPAISFEESAIGQPSIPILGVTPSTMGEALETLGPAARAWVAAIGFRAEAGAFVLVPRGDGRLSAALFGVGEAEVSDPLIAGALAKLPSGTYRLGKGFARPDLAALALALGAYEYTRFRTGKGGDIRLIVPDGVDIVDLNRVAAAVTLARDLINTPANRLGPAQIAGGVRLIAERYGASIREIVGEELVRERLPLIHAVGAAAAEGREPRLVDLAWGDAGHPKVTLVGKGVSFDTGGLDIKQAAGMRIMKKDMGGAANALALAMLIMDAQLPVRLRLLIPAVENAISGAAFRPGDVLESRKGLTVEIGNTDAEGRLILADALTLASEEAPALLLDFATLTGAARVALGPELPAIFSTDDGLADDLAEAARRTADPLWRMPLWKPYAAMLDSPIADIDNAGAGGFAGAITAALFLSRFVGEGIAWLHADIFAWNPKSRPARPEGGEAQTIRAIYEVLKQRYRS